MKKADILCAIMGIFSERKDYDRLVKEYPDLDKIMMGRGIMMNPFLMEEIADGTSQKVSGKMSADRKGETAGEIPPSAL